MAWAVRVYCDIGWVPEGAGGAAVMPTGGMANQPGYGPNQAAGPMMNAQTVRLQQAEAVTGISTAGLSASTLQTNIQTAITAAATDLNSQVNTALATAILAWETGGP